MPCSSGVEVCHRSVGQSATGGRGIGVGVDSEGGGVAVGVGVLAITVAGVLSSIAVAAAEGATAATRSDSDAAVGQVRSVSADCPQPAVTIGTNSSDNQATSGIILPCTTVLLSTHPSISRLLLAVCSWAGLRSCQIPGAARAVTDRLATQRLQTPRPAIWEIEDQGLLQSLNGVTRGFGRRSYIMLPAQGAGRRVYPVPAVILPSCGPLLTRWQHAILGTPVCVLGNPTPGPGAVCG